MVKIRTADISAISPVLESVSKTVDLAVGMNTYGQGIPVGAKIQSIVHSPRSVTLDKDCVDTVSTGTIKFTYSGTGAFYEMNCALLDAKEIIDLRGNMVIFSQNKDNNLTRDSYRSTKARSNSPEYKFKAYPINYSPSDRAIQQAGLREKSEAIIYTSMLDWMNSSIEFDKINTEKWIIFLDGRKYEIREKGLVSQHEDTFLNISFGIFKK